MLRLKVVVSASALFCVLAALPLYAVRRPDVPNSQNGEVVGVPAELCPNSTATPFFAQLDGTQSPPTGCTPTSDRNKPNPPAVYPNLSVTLSGAGFTVTVTPALWDIGLGISSNAGAKSTVFQVQFSGQAGMTLQSLVIGAKLNGATYVPCIPAEFGTGIPYCVALDNTLQSPDGLQAALEPAGIDLADSTTTRWDFSQFSSGTLAIVVTGYPSEFSKIDRYPNSNALTAASFAAANFLAVVTDASNNILTAGGLTLPTAPAATNDLFANAINIKKVPFKSFVDTSAASPTEVLSGTGAGSEVNPQGDPIPQDPAVADAGAPCSGSWPAGASVFRSVWYTFTPSTSGNYAISTAGSRYDTGVYVFTGSPSSPTPVACNDDAPNTGLVVQSSYINFGASAGTTYSIMVSEVPPPVGTDTATGTIPLAAPLATDATLQFSLKVGSSVVLSPNWVLPSFGTQKVKTTSPPKTIIATNTTSKAVSLSGIGIMNSGAVDFAQTSDCGTTLGPGSQCTISVTFTPKATGPFSANLVLHVSGGVSPTAVNLTGTGI
ncbi:MAG TPA: choice-of-anchor D domain-containing protein [Terriglobales bacterium]|nr:choice-of-anchor D domain-containing protein [Terriglobales bacterium]